MRIFFVLTFFFAGIFINSSCTVNYSFTGADIPAEAETISIGYFSTKGEKATLANPIAPDLFTNRLTATMLTQTSLDVVNSNGDLRFEGNIVEYVIFAVAAQSDTEASNRSRLKVSVNVIYTNTIEPDKSFEKQFSQFADFDASENLGDVEEDLLEVINDAIVQDIFNASLGSW